MTDLTEASAKAAEFIEALADELGDSGWAMSIWRGARELLPAGSRQLAPGEPAPNGWRYRVILFGPGGGAEADTNPDWPIDAEPVEQVASLPSLGEALQQVVAGFHEGHNIEGLDQATIASAIKGLRVSLSRNGGACWWNRAYTVDGVQWGAKVRVVRAN